MQPVPGKAPRDVSREASLAIERFLKASQKPVLIEPGDDPLPILADSFVYNVRGGRLTIECWSDSRNLVRRVMKIKAERAGRLELEVERFGGRTSVLTFIDMDRATNADAARRGARLKYRETFRQSLHRQFTGWTLVEVTTEADLEHSLSPAYPRAFLKRGSTGLAAIGAAEDSLDPDGALSFGLIWLDYLRRREKRLAIEGLAVFLPAGAENTICHRVRYLNPNAASYRVFVHGRTGLNTRTDTRTSNSQSDWEEAVDPRDYTNLETRLEPFRRNFPESGRPELSSEMQRWVQRIAEIPGVERRDRPNGSVSFAVNGLEIAHAGWHGADGSSESGGDGVTFGLDHKQKLHSERQISEIEQLAAGLRQMREAGADRQSPLYLRHPEAWLESRIRQDLSAIDAGLRAAPLYGQVPEMAGGERGILDLLACDYTGRLTVIEVKATQDIHMPLQALDYWMRVQWHAERGEFERMGYFRGIPLAQGVPPRLLLVAPALEWHPANELVLNFFSPEIEVVRLGVGLQWRHDLKVMFRSTTKPCPSV